MKKNKGAIAIFFIIIILIIFLTFRIYLLTSPEEKSEEKDVTDIEASELIYEENHSIFNGTPSGVIARRFSEVLDAPLVFPYGSKSTCRGEIRIEYVLQNDNHLTIQYFMVRKSYERYSKMELRQGGWAEKNGTYDMAYAEDCVLNFFREFLREFNVELGEDYTISTQIWGGNNHSWRVIVKQLYNGEVLNGTGVNVQISTSNGMIRVMDIFDWLDPNSLINESITIDDGRAIIYQEVEENGFNFSIHRQEEYYEENNHSAIYIREEYMTFPINQSDIKYIGYHVYRGRLGLTYLIHVKANETDECYHKYVIDIENGDRLFKEEYSDNHLTGSYS
jgi:hypothetical protein